jgi:hypothetical protein
VTNGSRPIDLIARSAGILSGYRDTKGAYVETSDIAKRAVLEGLGLDISSDTAALRTLEELRSRAALPLDPVVTARELDPCLIPRRWTGKGLVREKNGDGLQCLSTNTATGRTRPRTCEPAARVSMRRQMRGSSGARMIVAKGGRVRTSSPPWGEG